MALAQERYDNLQPPAFFMDATDDDTPTLDQCLEVAREQLLSTGAVVADALSVMCDPILSVTKQHPEPSWPGREPSDVAALCRPEFDSWGKPAYTLLAVLMTGDDNSAMRALRALRDRVAGALAAEIDARTAELFKEAQS